VKNDFGILAEQLLIFAIATDYFVRL